MPVCSVKTCKNRNAITKNKNIMYHVFPKDENICQQWVNFCDNGVLNIKHARVCSIHFSDDSYMDIPKHLQVPGIIVKKKLFPGTIPTIKIVVNNVKNSCDKPKSDPETSVDIVSCQTISQAENALEAAAFQIIQNSSIVSEALSDKTCILRKEMEDLIKLEPEEIEIKTEEIYEEDYTLEDVNVLDTKIGTDFKGSNSSTYKINNSYQNREVFQRFLQTIDSNKITVSQENVPQFKVRSDVIGMSEMCELYYLEKEFHFLRRQQRYYRMLYDKKNQKKKKIRDVPISSAVKLSWAAKAFITMQMRALASKKLSRKKRKMCETVLIMQAKHKFRPWSYREKKLAFLIYYKDKFFYTFLQKLGIILPPVSKMKKWMQLQNYLPGMSRLNLKHLQLKVETMEKNEKPCIVSFDILKINNKLEYSNDLELIEGYENLGPIGKFYNPAEYVLIFFMHGLYTKWTLPAVYYLINRTITAEYLKELIVITLTHINNAGLVPKILISRQSDFLNVQGELGVSVDKPFFRLKHKDSSRRIIFIFNVPDLIENVYNELLTKNFTLNNQIISFLNVESVYKLDNTLGNKRNLPVINSDHRQEMPLNLILQVFSQTMSEAMKTYSEEKRLRSDSAVSTANFIEMMSKFYDIMTKTSDTSNDQRLLDEDFPQQNLENLLETFQNLKRINDHVTESLDRPACFDGVVQTIRGLFILFSEEKNPNCTISTGIVNLKPLTDFLNKIKVINITAREFRLWYKCECVKMFSRTIESDLKSENIKNSDMYSPFEKVFLTQDTDFYDEN